MLQTLKEAGLKLNEENCKLRQTQIQFLGHIVDRHGVRPDMEKVEAIRNIQPLQNTTELKRVMGMVHYLGRYLPYLADVTCPLNDLVFISHCFNLIYYDTYFFSYSKEGRCNVQ